MNNDYITAIKVRNENLKITLKAIKTENGKYIEELNLKEKAFKNIYH